MVPYSGLLPIQGDSNHDGIDTGVASDEWIGSLGAAFLPNGADEILLVHWSDDQYGTGDDSNPNSVVPSSVCIAYTPVSSEADYGDAPSSYGSMCYYINDNNPTRLGNSVDGESSANTSGDAQGDDNDGIDDEDGVTFANPSGLTAGASESVTVSWSSNDNDSYISGWIDFNNNGTFDADEKVIDDFKQGAFNNTSTGSETFVFDVPADAVCGLTFARFIITSDPNEGLRATFASLATLVMMGKLKTTKLPFSAG